MSELFDVPKVKTLIEQGESPETIRQSYDLNDSARHWLKDYEETQKGLTYMALDQNLAELDALDETTMLPEVRWRTSSNPKILRPVIPLLAAVALLMVVFWPAPHLESGQTLDLTTSKHFKKEVLLNIPARTLVYIQVEDDRETDPKEPSEPVLIRVEDSKGKLVEMIKIDDFYSNAFAAYKQEAETLKLIVEPLEGQSRLRFTRDADLIETPEALAELAKGLYEQSEMKNEQGKLQEALRSLNRAAWIAAVIDDPAAAGLYLNRAGYYSNQVGKYLQGRTILQRSLTYLNSTEPTEDLSSALNNMGISNLGLEKAEEGISFLEKAFQNSMALGETIEAAKNLQNKANVYDQLDNPGNMIGTLERALDIIDLDKTYKDLQQFLNAGTREELSNDQEGLANLLASINSNIGTALNNLKNGARAIDFYIQALAYANLTQTHPDHQMILANLSWSYQLMADFDKALEVSLQSLKMKGKDQNRIMAYVNMGHLRIERAELDQAIEAFQAALAINPGDNRRLQRFAQYGMARALIAKRDNTQAQTYLHAALEGLEADSFFEVQVRSLMARGYAGAGKIDQALVEAERGIEIVEERRKEQKKKDNAAMFLASRIDPYDIKTELLMNQYHQTKDANKMREALQTAELTRARTLFESIKEAQTQFYSETPTELKLAKEDLRVQLNEVEAKLRRRDDGYMDRVQIADLEHQRVELQASYDRILNRIQDADRQIKEPNLNLPTIETIQKALDSNTTVAQLKLGESHSTLWLMTKNHLQAFQLPAGTILNDHSKDMRKSLQAGQLDSPARDALSDAILKPILEHFKGARLGIVADGELQYIPWDILKSTTGEPLLLETEVFYLPAFSLITQFMEPTFTNEKTLVLADPVYEANDSRFGKNPPQATAQLASHKVYRDANPYEGNLVRLSATHAEATSILKIQGADKTEILEGFQASKTNLLKRNLNDYDILHFATHGVLHKKFPERSGLMLSRYNANGEKINGFLGLHDIYRMDLDANLVIMSACDTASGKALAGEGIIGLTRAFMYAGAPRIVSTLWRVEDQGTAKLMELFYKELKNDNSPSHALHRARKQIWQQGQNNGSFSAIAFVLTGYWDSAMGHVDRIN